MYGPDMFHYTWAQDAVESVLRSFLLSQKELKTLSSAQRKVSQVGCLLLCESEDAVNSDGTSNFDVRNLMALI